MNYDPSIFYKEDRIVSIGTMSVVCEHCFALKFKDESKGMCCLQRKIKQSFIQTIHAQHTPLY